MHVFKSKTNCHTGGVVELPNIIQVLHNPLYDLNETVGSDIDFMLGAVFGQIISHSSWLHYVRRASKPTPEQYIKINSRLFSKAKLKTVPGVIEASEVNGVYDIVIKITSDSLNSLKDTIGFSRRRG